MYNLHCFGGLSLTSMGSVVNIHRKKSLALLTYLCFSNTPRPRRSLATLLWPDKDMAHALGNLRMSISEVNRACGEQIIISRSGNLSISSVLSCDAKAMIELACHIKSSGFSDLSVIEELLQSLSGKFLEGIDINASPEFDDWQYIIEEQCNKAMKTLHLCRIASLFKSGEDKDIHSALNTLSLMDLGDESLHRALMLSHSIVQDIRGMQRQFEICASTLKKDGNLLEDETLELFERLNARIIEEEQLRKLLMDELQLPDQNTSIPEGAHIEENREKRNKRPIILIAAFITMAVITITSLGWTFFLSSRGDYIPTVATIPLGFPPQSDVNVHTANSVTDQFIRQLQRQATLKVRPFSQIRDLRYSNISITEISDHINARYIIKGDLILTENKFGLNLQLLDGDTGEFIHQFNEVDLPKHRAEVLGFLAQEISAVIYSGLQPRLRDKISEKFTSLNPLCGPVYLAEQYHMDLELSMEQQAELFVVLQKFFSRDIYACLEYLRKSDVFWGNAFLGNMPPDGAYSLLKTAEDYLVETLPESAHIDIGRGVRQFLYEGDLSRAEEYFQSARKLEPSEPSVYRWLAAHAIADNRADISLEYIDQAEDFDRFNHMNQIYRIAALYFSRNYEKVLDVAKKYQKTAANEHCYPALFSGMSYLVLGNMEMAAKELQKSIALKGGGIAMAYQAYLFALTGQEQLAREAMIRISDDRVPEPDKAFMLKAIIASGLGEQNLSKQLLNEARLSKDPYYHWFQYDPLLTSSYNDNHLAQASGSVNQ